MRSSPMRKVRRPHSLRPLPQQATHLWPPGPGAGGAVNRAGRGGRAKGRLSLGWLPQPPPPPSWLSTLFPPPLSPRLSLRLLLRFLYPRTSSPRPPPLCRRFHRLPAGDPFGRDNYKHAPIFMFRPAEKKQEDEWYCFLPRFAPSILLPAIFCHLFPVCAELCSVPLLNSLD